MPTTNDFDRTDRLHSDAIRDELSAQLERHLSQLVVSYPWKHVPDIVVQVLRKVDWQLTTALIAIDPLVLPLAQQRNDEEARQLRVLEATLTTPPQSTVN